MNVTLLLPDLQDQCASINQAIEELKSELKPNGAYDASLMRSKILKLLKDFEVKAEAVATEKKGGEETLEEILKIITSNVVYHLDFSTLKDCAVFWTGYDKKNIRNQDTAMKYATSKQKQTIEMTQDGRILNQLNMYAIDSPIATGPESNRKSKMADLLFDAASVKFAQGAHGDVIAVIYNADSAEKKAAFEQSAYRRIEKEILLEREKAGLVSLKELVVPPEATLPLLEEIEQLQRELERYKLKELELTKQLEAKNRSEKKEAGESKAKSKGWIQPRVFLEEERKQVVKEQQDIVKKIELLLGINAVDIDKPWRLDSTCLAIGRRLKGFADNEDIFKDISSEDRALLEARLEAREEADKRASELKRAWSKRRRWEKRQRSSNGRIQRNYSLDSLPSTFSQVSDITLPKAADDGEDKIDLSPEQTMKALEDKVQLATVSSEEAQKRLRSLVQAAEELANDRRKKQGLTSLDPRNMEFRWEEKDEAFLQYRANQRRKAFMKTYCDENMARWIVCKDLTAAEEALAEMLKIRSPSISEAAQLKKCRDMLEEVKERYEVLAKIEGSVITAREQNKEEEALEELFEKDRAVVTFWNHFLSQTTKEESSKETVATDIAPVRTEDFFKEVDEKQDINLESIALRKYKKELQVKKTREVCYALMEGRESSFRGGFMHQLMEWRDKALKVSFIAQREAVEDWEKDRERREACRAISIANAYKYALVHFEREIERLRGIEAYWEERLTDAAAAYIDGDESAWRALTHEERKAYNQLMEKRNEFMKINDDLIAQNLKTTIQEMEERVRGFFAFAANKEEAIQDLKRSNQALLKHQDELRKRNELIRWTKLSKSQRKVETLQKQQQSRHMQAINKAMALGTLSFPQRPTGPIKEDVVCFETVLYNYRMAVKYDEENHKIAEELSFQAGYWAEEKYKTLYSDKEEPSKLDYAKATLEGQIASSYAIAAHKHVEEEKKKKQYENYEDYIDFNATDSWREELENAKTLRALFHQLGSGSKATEIETIAIALANASKNTDAAAIQICNKILLLKKHKFPDYRVLEEAILSLDPNKMKEADRLVVYWSKALFADVLLQQSITSLKEHDLFVQKRYSPELHQTLLQLFALLDPLHRLSRPFSGKQQEIEKDNLLNRRSLQARVMLLKRKLGALNNQSNHFDRIMLPTLQSIMTCSSPVSFSLYSLAILYGEQTILDSVKEEKKPDLFYLSKLCWKIAELNETIIERTAIMNEEERKIWNYLLLCYIKAVHFKQKTLTSDDDDEEKEREGEGEDVKRNNCISFAYLTTSKSYEEAIKALKETNNHELSHIYLTFATKQLNLAKELETKEHDIAEVYQEIERSNEELVELVLSRHQTSEPKSLEMKALYSRQIENQRLQMKAVAETQGEEKVTQLQQIAAVLERLIECQYAIDTIDRNNSEELVQCYNHLIHLQNTKILHLEQGQYDLIRRDDQIIATYERAVELNQLAIDYQQHSAFSTMFRTAANWKKEEATALINDDQATVTACIQVFQRLMEEGEKTALVALSKAKEQQMDGNNAVSRRRMIFPYMIDFPRNEISSQVVKEEVAIATEVFLQCAILGRLSIKQHPDKWSKIFVHITDLQQQMIEAFKKGDSLQSWKQMLQTASEFIDEVTQEDPHFLEIANDIILCAYNEASHSFPSDRDEWERRREDEVSKDGPHVSLLSSRGRMLYKVYRASDGTLKISSALNMLSSTSDPFLFIN